MIWLNATIAAGLLTLGAATPVAAQPSLELVDPERFTERFSGDAQVSGQFLTGLAFINVVDDFDLERIQIVGPARGQDGYLCVRVTSDDGRYWAANLYRSVDAPGDFPRVPIPTAYSDHLARYGHEGLLFMVSASPDCQSTSGQTLLPAVIGEPLADTALFAFVNVSQGRVATWLRDSEGRASESVPCQQPVSGIKVTYSHQCELPVTLASRTGAAELVVSVRSLTGATSEQIYAVHLD